MKMKLPIQCALVATILLLSAAAAPARIMKLWTPEALLEKS